MTGYEAIVLPTLGGLLFGAAGVAAFLGLRSRDAFREDIFHKSPTPTYVFDRKTLAFLDVNAAAIEHYGFTREEFLARRLPDIRPPEDVALLMSSLEKVDREAGGATGTFRHLTKDGRLLHVAIFRHNLDYHGIAACLVYALDITAQITTEQRLSENEAALALAQEMAHLGSFVYDHRTQTGLWSQELYRLLGADPQRTDATAGIFAFVHPEDAQNVRDEMERARRERCEYNVDHRIVRSDGTVRQVQERGYWTYDDRGAPERAFGTVLDITERKVAEDALAHLAYHDPLTNLLNRAGLRNQMRIMLTQRHAAGITPVYFLDLDRFKSLNDTLGPGAGDRLLVEIARRLARHLRVDELLARSGGDEFMLVSPPMRDRAEISARAREILETFSAPFTIGGIEHTVSASMGISVYPLDAREVDALLRNADVAMYAAKVRGGSGFQYYTTELQKIAEERFRLEAALRRALENGEFSMQYQPILSSRANRIVAVEALLRWRDAQRGMVPPSDFIPLAEETGFIGRIGEWIFKETFAQAKRWQSSGTPIRVWVNLCAAQLHDPSLPKTIGDLLREHELDGSSIGLELTESSFIDHELDVLERLHQIRELGVQFALDDFGVKYSSLEYLQRLPISTVKIDRVFVTNIETNRFHASIVRAIVGIAHDVGFDVTAEGVESFGELSALSALDCDAWQGFLYSTARPPAEIDAMLADPSSDKLQAK